MTKRAQDRAQAEKKSIDDRAQEQLQTVAVLVAELEVLSARLTRAVRDVKGEL